MKKKPDFPEINYDGTLNLNVINSMSFIKLRKWILNILHNEYPMLQGDINELPHFFLKNTFHKLNSGVRGVFEDIILEFLSELAQEPSPSWQNEAGDELLLLIQYIFQNSPRSKDPLDLLLYIVEKKQFLQKQQPNLHWRAVQTLIELKYITKSGFWKNIFLHGGIDYASLTFAGLTLSSLSEAFEWFIKEAKTPKVFDALMDRLPLLREEYGNDKLYKHLINSFPHIPESRIEEFRKITYNLDIPILSRALLELTDQKLLKLASFLEITIPSQLENKYELCFSIENELRLKSHNYKSYAYHHPDIEIISCISEHIISSPISLSNDFRIYFIDFVNKLLQIENFDDETMYLLAIDVSNIKEKGFNITQELEEIGEI